MRVKKSVRVSEQDRADDFDGIIVQKQNLLLKKAKM